MNRADGAKTHLNNAVNKQNLKITKQAKARSKSYICILLIFVLIFLLEDEGDS